MSLRIRLAGLKRLRPGDYTGQNWYQHAFTRLIWQRGQQAAFARFLKEQKFGPIRYPGGSQLALFFWQHPVEQWAEAASQDARLQDVHHGRSPEELRGMWTELSEFMAWIQEHDLTCILQLNCLTHFHEGRIHANWQGPSSRTQELLPITEGFWPVIDRMARDAGGLVAHCRDRGTLARVRYFELGNEEFYYYRAADFAEITSRFIRQIDAVDPRVPLVLTGQNLERPGWLEWSREVSRILGERGLISRLLGLTHHHYPLPKAGKPDARRSLEWAWPTGLPLDRPDVITPLAAAGPGKVFVTETRTVANADYFARTLVAALREGVVRLSAIRHPAVGGLVSLSPHNEIVRAPDSPAAGPGERNTGTGCYDYIPDADSPFVPSPETALNRLVAELVQGQAIEVTGDEPDVVCAATQHGRWLRVALVRMGLPEDAPRPVRLRLPSSRLRRWQQLGGPEVLATPVLPPGGFEPPPDRDPWLDLKDMPVAPDRPDVLIPPCSIHLLTYELQLAVRWNPSTGITTDAPEWDLVDYPLEAIDGLTGDAAARALQLFGTHLPQLTTWRFRSDP